MHANPGLGKRLDRGPYVHGIAAESIKFGNDQHVTPLKALEQSREALALSSRYRARDRLSDHSLPVDREARCLNLPDLIVGGLVGRGNAAVREYPSHARRNSCI